MAKTYIAKFNGSIVGKRTTKDRTYTHAVYVVPSKAWHVRQALEYAATATDRSNYEYHRQCAEGLRQCTTEDQIKSSTLIDGGFEAYVARIKARRIKDAEARNYDGGVVTWCGRRDLAEKAKRQYQQPWNLIVEVVEAEQIK